MLPVPVTTVNNPNNMVILNFDRSSFTQVFTVRPQRRNPSDGFSFLHTSFTKQLITKLELTGRVLQRRALQNTDYAATGFQEALSVTLCRSSKEMRWSGGYVKTYFSSGVNSVWYLHLCLRSGTLTQFLLVLYGTDSATRSSSEKFQPGSGSCKTLDLRQICIGKTADLLSLSPDVNILLR